MIIDKTGIIWGIKFFVISQYSNGSTTKHKMDVMNVIS